MKNPQCVPPSIQTLVPLRSEPKIRQYLQAQLLYALERRVAHQGVLPIVHQEDEQRGHGVDEVRQGPLVRIVIVRAVIEEDVDLLRELQQRDLPAVRLDQPDVDARLCEVLVRVLRATAEVAELVHGREAAGVPESRCCRRAAMPSADLKENGLGRLAKIVQQMAD